MLPLIKKEKKMNLKDIKKVLDFYSSFEELRIPKNLKIYDKTLIQTVVLKVIEQDLELDQTDQIIIKYIKETIVAKNKILEEQKKIKDKIREQILLDKIRTTENNLKCHKEELKKLQKK